MRRRNYGINDNANGDADSKVDSFAEWVKGGALGGKVIGIVDIDN
jgi:hypothetical protein